MILFNKEKILIGISSSHSVIFIKIDNRWRLYVVSAAAFEVNWTLFNGSARVNDIDLNLLITWALSWYTMTSKIATLKWRLKLCDVGKIIEANYIVTIDNRSKKILSSEFEDLGSTIQRQRKETAFNFTHIIKRLPTVPNFVVINPSRCAFFDLV